MLNIIFYVLNCNISLGLKFSSGRINRTPYQYVISKKFTLRKNSKLSAVAILSISAVIVTSFGFSSSYSLSNPLEFAEFMKQESGYASITVTGEDSAFLDTDSVVLMVRMSSPPADLEDAVDIYQENVAGITEKIKNDLDGFDNTSVSYLRANFDGDRYRYSSSSQSEDSYMAYMSFPIKVDMKTYQEISREIVELGLHVDDIRISQVPVKTDSEEDDTSATKEDEPVVQEIGLALGSGAPGCEISSECFLPYDITVDPGTTLVWMNDDSAAHTVTSGTPDDGPDGVFDSGLFMTGTSYSFDFNAPGIYDYFCMVHPWMEGIVTVTGNPEDTEFDLEVTINVRLETKPDTLQNTLDSYSQTVDDLSNLLRENGVSETIPRSSVNINPTYHDRWASDSYRAESYWNVKTTMDDLVQVHDIVSQYGGIHNIYMSYSENAVDNIREELVHNALEDAKLKVLEIIDPMDLEIKGIKKIDVNQNLAIENHREIRYNGVSITMDDWNNFRDGNASVAVDVEFEVGPKR